MSTSNADSASSSFTFRRARGIAWVCDLANSTHFLNDKASVAELEDFIPRLHLFARMVTSAAQGRFVKWTGDGFFAWFETPLHREADAHARRVFAAAWHLSNLVKVTGLGLETGQKFKLRHGITLEHDAWISEFPASAENAWDLLGRNINLAFRLASIDHAAFPNVFTTTEVLQLTGSVYGYSFKAWKPKKDEVLKYFKGEPFGTSLLQRSEEKKTRKASSFSTKSARSILTAIEEGKPADQENFEVVCRMIQEFDAGPEFVRGTLKSYIDYIKQLRQELISLVGQIEELQKQLNQLKKAN